MMNIKKNNPNVATIYPSFFRKRMYKKKESRIRITFFQAVSLHILINIPFSFLSRMDRIIMKRENAPKTIPAQKGRNPGPGDLKEPTST
jgi:hypothetical protein